MDAVIKIKGFQIPVKKGQKVVIPYTSMKEGEYIEADVIMSVKEGKVSFEGGKAKLKVVGEKEEKVLVFKMKRKKNYRRLYNHIQKYTVALVEEIG